MLAVESVPFVGYRFPSKVILLAVCWYLRYGLSYRDVEEALAERGVEMDHVTIYQCVQRFTPLLIDAARSCRHGFGDRWFVTPVDCTDGGPAGDGQRDRAAFDVTRRHGPWAILVLAFVPNPIYAWSSVAAGASKTSFGGYFLAAATGSAARFILIAFLGTGIERLLT